MDMSINVPKQSVTGICMRYMRRSARNCERLIMSGSVATKRRFTMMVHWPMVRGVNILST